MSHDYQVKIFKDKLKGVLDILNVGFLNTVSIIIIIDNNFLITFNVFTVFN